MNETKWLQFEFRGTTPSGKTSIWAVISKLGHRRMGTVKWAAQWRRYAFFPKSDCEWIDAMCLRDIATFCEQKMTERKEGR